MPLETVSDLKKILSQFPDDARVELFDGIEVFELKNGKELALGLVHEDGSVQTW